MKILPLRRLFTYDCIHIYRFNPLLILILLYHHLFCYWANIYSPCFISCPLGPFDCLASQGSPASLIARPRSPTSSWMPPLVRSYSKYHLKTDKISWSMNERGTKIASNSRNSSLPTNEQIKKVTKPLPPAAHASFPMLDEDEHDGGNNRQFDQ